MVDDEEPAARDQPAAARRPRRRPVVLKPAHRLSAHPTDSSAEARQRRQLRRRRFKLTEAGVALAALLVSATAFMVSGAMYLRGSEIVGTPPETILIYRDAGPTGAELWIAVPVSLINAASTDYGDVVTSATLRLVNQENAVHFNYEAIVESVMVPGPNPVTMTRRVERAIETCPTGARCIAGLGHYVIERPKRLLDVPGGGSRSEHLAFQLTTTSCRGSPGACSVYGGYDRAVSALRRKPGLTVRVDLEFQFDDPQQLLCTVDTRYASWTAILAYLERTGWVTGACLPTNR